MLSVTFASCDNSTNTNPITKYKPANKAALVAEIKRAMKAHGNDVDLNYIDTSAITNMSLLFAADYPYSEEVEGYGLHEFEGDISKWNVSKVTDMIAMFADATAFNSDVSKWNVSEVTNMKGMFAGALKFNRDISGWDVSEVTDMIAMFSGATSFKQNLDAWGSRINDKIKAKNWITTINMFTNSGLKDSLPTWCETVPSCKKAQ